jgi:hypothetical protein
LAQANDVDTLSSELESRLDDLFGENDIPLPAAQDRHAADHYPLAELKNLILSIDWEITDDVLRKFLQQLQDLKLTYKHDKIVWMFLQILNSLGDYIKTNRGKSHPKTFKTLNSVFSSLDRIVLAEEMSETAKRKILLAEMNRYKELKAEISLSKSVQQRKAKTVAPIAEKPIIETTETTRHGETATPAIYPADTVEEQLSESDQHQGPSDISSQEAVIANLSEAVREIKRYFNAEIKALKEEIIALIDRQK